MDLGGDKTETAEAEPAEDNSLDFDVSSLDFSLDADSSDTQPAAEEVLDMDFSSMEMDTPAETSAEDMASELDEMLGNDIDELTEDAFGEVDEVGTKLDLAKAYVDMGDSDGARSILDEVMEEGDDGQKAQAKELLGQIG